MTAKTIDLALLDGITLKSGGHSDTKKDYCIMEAVAYVAGEPWSDHPQCACPVITSLMISWNDSLPTDAMRDKWLKPLIPQIVGTRNDEALVQRAYLLADAALHQFTPFAFEEVAKAFDLLEGLTEHAKALRDHAETLRAFPAIVDAETANTAWSAAGAAESAAWSAAESAAESAARSAAGAAWSAAGAAESAARSAAGAAWSAAGAAESAAESAAGAARSAAESAAGAARSAAESAAGAAESAAGAAESAAGAAWEKNSEILDGLVRRMCEIGNAATDQTTSEVA